MLVDTNEYVFHLLNGVLLHRPVEQNMQPMAVPVYISKRNVFVRRAKDLSVRWRAEIV
jgi:hypothetical protein